MDIKQHSANSIKELMDSNPMASYEINDYSHIMVAYTSVEGKWLKIPQTLCRLLGYTEMELLGKKYSDVFFHEDFPNFNDKCQTLINGEAKSFELEKRYVTKKGINVWVYICCNIVLDATNKPSHIINYIKDISKRKNAELEMLRSFELQIEEKQKCINRTEERFKRIVESANEGIWEIDRNGNSIFINDRMSEMLGYSQDEILGSNVLDFVFETDKEITKQRVTKNMDGLNDQFDFRFRKKNGEEILVLGCTSPVMNSDNKVSGALGLFTDITERKKLEDELQHKQKELVDFIENASIGLHWVDENGLIKWANKTEMNLLGYESNEYIGKNVKEFHADENCINEIMKKLRNNETLKNFEAKLRCKDGSIKHVIISSNVYYEKGKFVHTRCFTKDITEKKLIEEILKNKERSLIDYERKNRKDLQKILEKIPVGAYTCNANGYITWYNNNAVNLWGRKPRLNDPIDRYCGSHRMYMDNVIIRPDQSWMARCLKENKEFLGEELSIERPDGSVKNCLLYISPLNNDKGEVTGAINIILDITDKKTAERRLKIQYSISKALAESSSFKEASEKVIRSICEGLDWDLGSIWLVDKNTGRIKMDSYWTRRNNSEAIKNMYIPYIEFESGQGLPGTVWKSNNPIWIEYIRKDDNFPRFEYALNAGLTTCFAFPIRYNDEVFGVIECFNKRPIKQNTELLEVLNVSGIQIGNFLAGKKAEEEKIIAQNFYQSLFETTLDGILAIDENGKYINVNESYCKMLKAGREDLIGKDFSTFMPDDMINEATAAFSDLKNKGFFKGEFPLKALDGSIVYAEWMSKSNVMPGIHFCVARDITERKIAENKLKDEYLFRCAIENSTASGLAIVDKNGHQCFVNPAFCNMLGWTKEELTNKYPPYLYWPEDEVSEIMNAFNLTLEGNAPENGFELIFKKKNNEKINVLVKVTPVRNNEFDGWLASITDITSIKNVQRELEESQNKLEQKVDERTMVLKDLINELKNEIVERKKKEEELKIANEKLNTAQKELIQSEKFSSLGRFASNIAHEIRNPLSNINALAQLINKEKHTDPKLKKHLKYILENSKLANQIIKDLLTYSSPHNTDISKISINKLLTELSEIVSGRCKKNKIELICELNTEGININGNKEKILAAFLNFVSNSIDAMENGGKLKIISVINENNTDIIFEDNGSGIPSDIIDKIHEPFFTTKNSGTGLGLSLAYEVIKSHSGKIEIESRVNKGTKIKVTLPVLKKNINK